MSATHEYFIRISYLVILRHFEYFKKFSVKESIHNSNDYIAYCIELMYFTPVVCRSKGFLEVDNYNDTEPDRCHITLKFVQMPAKVTDNFRDSEIKFC
jgi:hypothetical protein